MLRVRHSHKAKDNHPRGAFVCATDTAVGKTYIARLLIAELLTRSVKLNVYKPVESGCQQQGQRLHAADAAALAAATQGLLTDEQVCPYRFQAVASPARAAHLAGSRLRIADLSAACARTSPEHFLLLEGAGGIYSPIAEDGLNADLAQALALPVALVVPDRLGCVSHALLSVEALRRRGVRVSALLLNALTETGAEQQDTDNQAELSALLEETILKARYDVSGHANKGVIRRLADCLAG